MFYTNADNSFRYDDAARAFGEIATFAAERVRLALLEPRFDKEKFLDACRKKFSDSFRKNEYRGNAGGELMRRALGDAYAQLLDNLQAVQDAWRAIRPSEQTLAKAASFSCTACLLAGAAVERANLVASQLKQAEEELRAKAATFSELVAARASDMKMTFSGFEFYEPSIHVHSEFPLTTVWLKFTYRLPTRECRFANLTDLFTAPHQERWFYETIEQVFGKVKFDDDRLIVPNPEFDALAE